MKNLLLLAVFTVLFHFNLSGQTNPCDLPATVNIREVPLFKGTHSTLIPMRSELIYQTVDFRFPDWANLFVDFGDGSGVQEVATGEIVTVNYPTTGEFEINYDQPDSDLSEPSSLEHSFKIRINPTTGAYVLPDERWTVTTDNTVEPPVSDIFPPDSPYAGNQTGSALVSIKYADGNTELTNPVLFVTGYDPNPTAFTDPNLPADNNIIRYGGNGWDVFIKGAGEAFLDAARDIELFKEYPQTIQDLSALGYDLLFVDFSEGGDYVQKNAELLIEVIERVNAEKIPDSAGDLSPNVVIGASMGGLIARYSLKKMEERDIKHCTKTFVAFDSPMKGATAPLAAQSAIWFNYAVSQDTPEPNDDGCGARDWNALRTPAAMQLLENHIGRLWEAEVVELNLVYWDDDFIVDEENISVDLGTGYTTIRNQFKNEMENLGYPEKCELIAIACGNQTGQGHGYTSGATLFDGELEASGDKKILELELFAGQGNVVNQECNNFCVSVDNEPDQFYGEAVFGAITPHLDGSNTEVISVEGICAYHIGSVVLTEPQPFFDGAPGSFRPDLLGQQKKLKDIAEKNNLTDDVDIPLGNEKLGFVPTVSALDIEGVWSDELLFTNIQNLNPIDNNLTPFNSFYAPQSISLKHVEIDDDIKDYVLGNIGTWSSQGNLNLTAGQTYNHADRLRLINNTTVNDGAVLAVNGNTGSGFGGGAASPDGSLFKASGFFGCIPTDVTVRDGGEFKIGSISSERRGEAVFYEGSTVEVETGGKLTVAEGSSLIIEDGATLFLNLNATANVKGNGRIEIREGGTLILSNPTLDLEAVNSVVEIHDGATVRLFGGDLNVPSFHTPGIGKVVLYDGYNLQLSAFATALHLDGAVIELKSNAEIILPPGKDLTLRATTVLYGAGAKIKTEEGEVRVALSQLVSEDGAAYGVQVDNPSFFSVSGSMVRGLTTGFEINNVGFGVSCSFLNTRFLENAYGVRVNRAMSKISFAQCRFDTHRGAAAYFAETQDMVVFNDCNINGDRANVLHNLDNLSDAGNNNGIQLLNSVNLTLKATEIQHCNLGINGILDAAAGNLSDLDVHARNENNIVLTDGTALRNNTADV